MLCSKYSRIARTLRRAERPLSLKELSERTGLLPGTIVQVLHWSNKGVRKFYYDNRVFYEALLEARDTKGSGGRVR